jgi:thiamine pyrophosphate-dependent acetolactate synthase large subunit-like protein
MIITGEKGSGQVLWDSDGGYRKIEHYHAELMESVRRAYKVARQIGKKGPAALHLPKDMLLHLESMLYFLSVEIRRLREDLVKTVAEEVKKTNETKER